MKKLQALAAGLAVLFAAAATFADSGQSGRVKMVGEVTVVWSEAGSGFTVEVRGRLIERVPGNSFAPGRLRSGSRLKKGKETKTGAIAEMSVS